MSLSLVTAPTALPLTVADAQLHLRVDAVDDDKSLLELAIAAATERCEAFTKRALITQTWDYVIDQFPPGDRLELPKPPVQSVQYVHYVDMSGVTQTLNLAVFLVQLPQGPRARRAYIARPFQTVWPITLPQMGAVTIRFTCGYGDDADTVPALLRAGIKLDLGTLYENREGIVMAGRQGSPDTLPMGVQDIYRTYRSQPTQRGDVAA